MKSSIIMLLLVVIGLLAAGQHREPQGAIQDTTATRAVKADAQ